MQHVSRFIGVIRTFMGSHNTVQVLAINEVVFELKRQISGNDFLKITRYAA